MLNCEIIGYSRRDPKNIAPMLALDAILAGDVPFLLKILTTVDVPLSHLHFYRGTHGIFCLTAYDVAMQGDVDMLRLLLKDYQFPVDLAGVLAQMEKEVHPNRLTFDYFDEGEQRCRTMREVIAIKMDCLEREKAHCNQRLAEVQNSLNNYQEILKLLDELNL